jgi:putative ABC transport system permease protein
MNILNKPSFAFLIRNWKSGELQLMFFAIFISVVCITSVVFFTRGLSLGLEDKSGALLGGDRALTSPTPIDHTIIQKAKQLNLKTATTATFLSVLVNQNHWALANVEAVSEHYPLKGELRVAPWLKRSDSATREIPKTGTVWLEERLFTQLNVKPGNKIYIGKTVFKVDKILTAEPARTLEGFDIAPRAIINEKDMDKTGILSPGVRANHKMLVTGSEANLHQFTLWLTPKLNPSQTFLDARSNRQLVKMALDRLDRYLGLVFIINVTLAGIAIAMVGRRFSQRQFDTVAILRCFGASYGWILRQYCLSFAFLGLIAGFLGIGVGFGLERIMNIMFKDIFFYTPPTTLWAPIAGGLLTALVLLFGFALPPLLNLRKVPPMRVLRRDLVPPSISSVLMTVVALLSVSGLLIFQTADLTLTVTFILATFGISLVVLSIIYVILKTLPSVSRFLNITSQLIIRNIASRARDNTFQVLAFALVLTFGASLFLVRTDLMQTWQDQIPPRAPNYFAINIAQNALDEFKHFLHKAHIEETKFFPVVQGRLMAVNDEAVELNSGSTKNRVLNRLLNLTWTSELPPENNIITGQWFKSSKEKKLAAVSIEQKFAQLMKIQLNDILKFHIGDETIKAKVTSIREVNWDSFHPNFYVIFPPGVIEKSSKTYMTSFYVDKDENNFLKKLVKKFPSVTLVDTKMVMSEVKSFLGLVSWGVQYLWSFTLIASFILLFATITATLDERQYEAILLRVLGISNRRLLWILLAEFLLLGLLAGLVGAVSAHFIVRWLSWDIFGLPYVINYLALMAIPIMGMGLIGLGGWIGTKRVFLMPPIQMFREV